MKCIRVCYDALIMWTNLFRFLYSAQYINYTARKRDAVNLSAKAWGGFRFKGLRRFFHDNSFLIARTRRRLMIDNFK